MEDKIKTIEIDGVEFPFNANKAFEKDGHVYCRQCGEQIDSEPLACLGSKNVFVNWKLYHILIENWASWNKKN